MTDQRLHLTDRDGQRLTAFFEADRCIFTCAKCTKTPVHELIAWSTQPHIKAALELVSRSQAEALLLSTIRMLSDIAEKTESLIEKRRAACAVLRALTTPMRPARSREPRQMEPTAQAVDASQSKPVGPSCDAPRIPSAALDRPAPSPGAPRASAPPAPPPETPVARCTPQAAKPAPRAKPSFDITTAAFLSEGAFPLAATQPSPKHKPSPRATAGAPP